VISEMAKAQRSDFFIVVVFEIFYALII